MHSTNERDKIIQDMDKILYEMSIPPKVKRKSYNGNRSIQDFFKDYPGIAKKIVSTIDDEVCSENRNFKFSNFSGKYPGLAKKIEDITRSQNKN